MNGTKKLIIPPNSLIYDFDTDEINKCTLTSSTTQRHSSSYTVVTPNSETIVVYKTTRVDEERREMAVLKKNEMKSNKLIYGGKEWKQGQWLEVSIWSAT